MSTEELLVRVVELEELVLVLQAEIEKLRRGGQRQATPFSKGERKPNPKKSGRKARGTDSDNFTFRLAPAPEDITEPVVEVALKVASGTHTSSEPICCPTCGGAMGDVRKEMAYLTGLPPVIKPRVRAFRVEVCHCSKCGKSVRASHPELAEDQYGASSHRLEPGVMAAAHILHMAVGVTLRKVPEVLHLLTGIRLTQSAITQDMLRRSQAPSQAPSVQPEGEIPLTGATPAGATPAGATPAGAIWQANEQLRAEITQEKSIHTDDTGWSIFGDNAYLMAFETPKTSVFQIRYRHRNEEVREVIPSEYPGTMVTDRGRSYDAREFDQVKQQKCISHIQKNIKETLAKKECQGQTPEKMQFCLDLKGLLRRAMALRKRQQTGETPDGPDGPDGEVPDFQVLEYQELEYQEQAAAIEKTMSQLLQDRPMEDRDDRRLLSELGYHHDRGNLLRFLKDPEVEPTNNRAERGLRPAVIARKVSQCSKNKAGADAFAAFASVINTLKKRTNVTGVPTISLIEALCQVFWTGRIQCASP